VNLNAIIDSIKEKSIKDLNLAYRNISNDIDWDSLSDSVYDKIDKNSIPFLNERNFTFALKAFIIQVVYDIDDSKIETEIYDRKSFQKFLNISSENDIPAIQNIKSLRTALDNYGLLDGILNLVNEVLSSKENIKSENYINNEVIEDKINEIESRINEIFGDEIYKSESGELEESEKAKIMTDRLSVINQKIDNLIEKHLSPKPEIKDIINGRKLQTDALVNKLSEIKEKLSKITPVVIEKEKVEPQPESVNKQLLDSFSRQLDKVTDEVETERSEVIENVLKESDVKIDQLEVKNDTLTDEITTSEIDEKKNTPSENIILTDIKIEDSDISVDKTVKGETDLTKDVILEQFEPVITQKDETADRLKKIDEEIKIFTQSILTAPIPPVITDSVVEEKKDEVTEVLPPPVEDVEVISVEKEIEEPLVKEMKILELNKEIEAPVEVEVPFEEKAIIPEDRLTEEELDNEIDLKKKKKFHIFNDINLTEDYELGLRFYKLGFKTAFINMRVNEDDENTRIATAEYFPNTFWGCVKQRSRWIAGISFQNWKIHKWTGSLKTKYFLMRDRKAIWSFFGIFLSNLVFLYFLIYMAGLIFGFKSPEPLVETGSFLYVMMVATLVFLFSRVVHRFTFTYNWYGWKYAAFSIVRLIFDNMINFFAIIRAVKVYKTNKKKIVWDATDHY
jgi:hypothetical protein